MYAFYMVRKDLHDEWFGTHNIYLVWWCDLLRHAEWKTKSVSIKNKTVTLHPGEQVASINDLVVRWKRGKDMIINFIELLKEKGLIEKWSSNNISIIRIINNNIDVDADNLSNGKTDNNEIGKTPDTQSVSRTLEKDKADNLYEEATDNSATHSDNLADNLADNLLTAKTDNLETELFPSKIWNPRGSQWNDTDNLSTEENDNSADNLADTTPIYKEKRRKISTTATRDSINNFSDGGIVIDVAIKMLIADKFQLLQIQRYTGISMNDIILWSVEYVERCGIQRGGYNSKGYNDVITHFTDWLKSQKTKGRSPRLNLIQTETQAKETWNKVQAQLLLDSAIPEEIILSLIFDKYDLESQYIGIIAPDSETKTIINKEYKTEIENTFSRYTQTKIRIRFGVIEEQVSQV
ncbi:MAG: hypothetical protein IJ614_01575 [Prevotella sp.]|nr:hypothetical protein [Prevotella sp.]